jgi:hypothetical protein
VRVVGLSLFMSVERQVAALITWGKFSVNVGEALSCILTVSRFSFGTHLRSCLRIVQYQMDNGGELFQLRV